MLGKEKSKRNRIEIVNIVAVLASIFGSEEWILTEGSKNRINATEMGVLWKIEGKLRGYSIRNVYRE